jgi:hypothetical protein
MKTTALDLVCLDGTYGSQSNVIDSSRPRLVIREGLVNSMKVDYHLLGDLSMIWPL